MTEALKLKEIACQAGKQNDCRIYDIYRHKDRLQVFIDKRGAAVRLEDCENVFHSLRFLLLNGLPQLLKSHRLEVSSPGLERRLREKWHFEEALGETVHLVTFSPVSLPGTGQRAGRPTVSFQAKLTAVLGESLQFQKGSAKWELSFSKVKSARMFFPNGGCKTGPKAHTKSKRHRKARRSRHVS